MAHKYRATRTVVDGIAFPSKREAKRWSELLLLVRAKAICDLERQPVFPIFAVGLLPVPTDDTVPSLFGTFTLRKVGRYTGDFAYTDTRTGERVIEDVKTKATATTAYRLRKKIVEAMYGIRVVEV
jgi:hypothetical protein